MYQIVDRLHIDPVRERERLIAGLRATPASIPPKYFYDPLGCALFCAICELDEYYPTRTEAAIFARHRSEIAAVLGTRRQFVDLGAGDCAKAVCWLPFLTPRRYIAVDIARSALERSLSRLTPDFPEMPILGIVTDFSETLDLGKDLEAAPTTFFYPGSSIGNFNPAGAIGLLRQVRALGGHEGNLLIGVDTKKSAGRLDSAYADALGVTAAFNLNALRHVNRLIGSDFALDGFVHRGFYDARASRVEMHLEARGEQRVHIDGTIRVFGDGERIHTENSYKYSPPEFASLLEQAGFRQIRCWQDDNGDFAVYVASG